MPVTNSKRDDDEVFATPRNMRALADRPVGGARLVAVSQITDEEYSASPGDYWWVGDDEPIIDSTGRPMVLAFAVFAETVLVTESVL